MVILFEYKTVMQWPVAQRNTTFGSFLLYKHTFAFSLPTHNITHACVYQNIVPCFIIIYPVFYNYAYFILQLCIFYFTIMHILMLQYVLRLIELT